MFVKPVENVTIENARLMFQNFSGRRGNREFGVVLPRELALQMKAVGWNVKQFEPHEDGVEEPDFYILIKIGTSKSGRLPKIDLINSHGRVTLQNVDDLDNLDKIDIDKIDVTIFPYHWKVGENYGVSACVKTLHITANDDISDFAEV